MTDLVWLCIFSALSGYLLGGINGAIILSRLVYHEDIRKLGSGNPGFTNFKRIHGFCPATFAAMAIDIFKTIIPVVTFMILFGQFGYAGQLGAVLTLLFSKTGQPFAWMMYSLLSGGVLLGAIFMATDYATSPVTPKGQLLYGVGCGVLTVLFRYFGLYPEGVTYAILLMNACVWAADRYTAPTRFGTKKGAAQ